MRSTTSRRAVPVVVVALALVLAALAVTVVSIVRSRQSVQQHARVEPAHDEAGARRLALQACDEVDQALTAVRSNTAARDVFGHTARASDLGHEAERESVLYVQLAGGADALHRGLDGNNPELVRTAVAVLQESCARVRRPL